MSKMRKKINKWWKNLPKNKKSSLIWALALALIISIPILSIITYINFSSSHISTYECDAKITKTVREALSLQEQNKILAFIYAFERPINLMLLAIGIAWVLHGVGFRIA